MGSRFEIFSDQARRVLSISHEEAERFNHNYIGTEHILLALTRDTEGAAARVLSGLGVDLNGIRSRVELHIGRGTEPTQGEIGLTPRSKKVVELAVDEARRTHQTRIGTEHLLIGLLREGEGVAAGELESLGVNLEEVREAVLHIPRDDRASAQMVGPAQLAVRIEEIIQRLARLENTLNRRFDELEGRMAKLEELLRDR